MHQNFYAISRLILQLNIAALITCAALPATAQRGKRGTNQPQQDQPQREDKKPKCSEAIDLSSQIGQTITVRANHEVVVCLQNKLPGVFYNVTTERSSVAIPPLTLPADYGKITVKKDGEIKDPCAGLLKEVVDLYAVDDEEKLPSIVQDLNRKIIAAGSRSECSPEQVEQMNAVLASTTAQAVTFKLRPGEQIVVKVTRQIDGQQRTWTQTYVTEARGEFQISYGFSFIGQVWDKERVYYAAPTDSAYTIRKENGRNRLVFAPSLFFTWMPAKSRYEDLSFGVSGGLGFDASRPTIFLGPTLSYNQNIKLHVGVVAHQQRVLLGQYNENQRISEPLTEAQLHNNSYVINPFFSLSFRFSEAPFNRAQGQQ